MVASVSCLSNKRNTDPPILPNQEMQREDICPNMFDIKSKNRQIVTPSVSCMHVLESREWDGNGDGGKKKKQQHQQQMMAEEPLLNSCFLVKAKPRRIQAPFT